MIEPLGTPEGSISHREVLTRARADLYRDLNELNLRAEEEGLPGSFYDEERRAIVEKIGAVNGMLYYECGERC